MLIRPRTNAGAPGRRVVGRSAMISCAELMSHPYTPSPTRKSSVGDAAMSGVDVVESKEVQRVGLVDRYGVAGGGDDRAVQLFRQGRTQIDQVTRDRMPE